MLEYPLRREVGFVTPAGGLKLSSNRDIFHEIVMGMPIGLHLYHLEDIRGDCSLRLVDAN